MTTNSSVLVTGGAGYLGSTLVGCLLAEGYTVRVLDTLSFGGQSLLGYWSHPSFEFIRGDIRDSDAVRRSVNGISAVVHLAAIVGDPACARNPLQAREVNVAGSLTVLEECRRRKIKQFVFASTCSIYGKPNSRGDYLDETSPLVPLSLYAETKIEIEQTLQDAGVIGGMCVTALRFATLFGVSPRMRFDLTVNEFTMRMFARKHLTVYGQHAWRPYIHVRDAARAIHSVLKTPNNVRARIFNVGSTGQNFRKADVLRKIQTHVAGSEIEYLANREDLRDYRVNFDKIAQELGFEATITVDAGVAELVELLYTGTLTDLDDPKFRN